MMDFHIVKSRVVHGTQYERVPGYQVQIFDRLIQDLIECGSRDSRYIALALDGLRWKEEVVYLSRAF